MWDRDLAYLGDLPVWWVPFSALKSYSLCPVSCWSTSLHWRVERVQLSPLFLSHWVIWVLFFLLTTRDYYGMCVNTPLPPTGTSLPSCSPDLYGSSHPAEHTSVYMCCSDIWCCLGGFSDLASSVCWETETVNLGNFFCFLFPFYKD